MLIICPTCAMSFQVHASAISESGRTVRCAYCKTVWVATPQHDTSDETVTEFRTALSVDSQTVTAAAAVPPEFPASIQASEPIEPNAPEDPTDAAPELTAQTPSGERPIALADIPIRVDDAPPLAPKMGNARQPAIDAARFDNSRNDVEFVAARRGTRPAPRKRQGRPRLPLPAVIVVLVVACTALLAWRKDVVRRLPQLASLYSTIGLPVNLRGLEFTDLKIANEMQDGVPVLVVEGIIVSAASMAVEVPRLRFGLRNAAGAEVCSWTAMPTRSVLAPGDNLPFHSRLAAPPADGQNVAIRFFTRRDAAMVGSR